MLSNSEIKSLEFIDQLGGTFGCLTPSGTVPMSMLGANAKSLLRLGLVEKVIAVYDEEMVALSGAGRVYIRDFRSW